MGGGRVKISNGVNGLLLIGGVRLIGGVALGRISSGKTVKSSSGVSLAIFAMC